MIRAAYAVVHFKCDVVECNINDTFVTDNKNVELGLFEMLQPDTLWDLISESERLAKWTLKEGAIRCPYHTHIKPMQD